MSNATIAISEKRLEKAGLKLERNLSSVLGRGKGKCPKVYGHSASAIVRWMGYNGWSFDDAWVAMLELGCGHLSERAVTNGLKFGKLIKKGYDRYGYIPELTRGQQRQIKQASC